MTEPDWTEQAAEEAAEEALAGLGPDLKYLSTSQRARREAARAVIAAVRPAIAAQASVERYSEEMRWFIDVGLECGDDMDIVMRRLRLRQKTWQDRIDEYESQYGEDTRGPEEMGER